MVTQVLSRADAGQVTTTAILAVEKVSFRYQDAPVLRDLDFEVAAGSVVALVGRSGAGKTPVVSW